MTLAKSADEPFQGALGIGSIAGQTPQLQQHFGYAASQKDAYSWMSYRPIGQNVNKPRHFSSNFLPVFENRTSQSCCMCNCRNV